MMNASDRSPDARSGGHLSWRWYLAAFIGIVLLPLAGYGVLCLRNAVQASATRRLTVPERVFAGHTRWVTEAAFTPDGLRVLSASADYTIRTWDARTGAELKSIPLGQSDVQPVAFSPDGRRALVGSAEGPIDLLDLESWKTLRVMNVDRPIPGGPDGPEGIDPAPQEPPIFSLAFTPDGERALSGGEDGAIVLWDLARGAPLRILPAPRSSRAVPAAYVLAVSPDARRCAASYRGGGTVRLWDLTTGQLLHELWWNRVLAFSPDGKQIVLFGGVDPPNETLALTDVATGRCLRTLTGHTGGSITSVAFDSTGRRAVSGGSDGTLRLWDLATGEELCRFVRPQSRFRSVAFSPDGRFILSGGEGGPERADHEQAAELFLWRVPTERELRLWRLFRIQPPAVPAMPPQPEGPAASR